MHLFGKSDSISSKNSAGEKFPFDQEQFGATLGGPLRRNRTFYFLAYDEQRFRQTKQTNPARIEPRIVDFFAALGSPNENGPIERTNDARVFLGKIDQQITPSNLLTVRYNYTWSRQENGTFDVDSWGRSANGLERDFSNAVSGSLLSTLSGNTLNEFRFQYAREDRPRPYDGPDITGQTRPFPDTAFDFGSSYRFGEPFFLPVEYYDTRLQLTNNFSIIKGRHTIKVGGEFNRVTSVQTFIGFANGRYIFGSTDGFLNYVRQGPRYVECSNGTSNATGSCPAGTTITGPLLLFLQQAGVGSLSVEEAGTQDIPQLEPSLFIQDKWQPNSRLTVQYGLRWEAQIQPDPITPPAEVFYAGFIGRPGFPSDGTIPSDKKMFQPRLGLSWDPQGNGKQVVRFSSGLFYARIPGLSLASSRSTNGSRGQSLYRDSTFNGFGVTPPAWPNLIPQSAISSPDHPDVFVFDKDFRNPRTWSNTVAYERQVAPDLSAFVSFTHSDTDHITRFINRNDAVFGSPWRTGLGAGGTQRHRRVDDGREHGEVAVRRAHARDEQEVLAGVSVPGELHAVARSLGRRQRARPVHVPVRPGRQPGARVQLLRSRSASPVQRLAAHRPSRASSSTIACRRGPRSRSRSATRRRIAFSRTARSSSGTRCARTTSSSAGTCG